MKLLFKNQCGTINLTPKTDLGLLFVNHYILRLYRTVAVSLKIRTILHITRLN